MNSRWAVLWLHHRSRQWRATASASQMCWRHASSWMRARYAFLPSSRKSGHETLIVCLPYSASNLQYIITAMTSHSQYFCYNMFIASCSRLLFVHFSEDLRLGVLAHEALVAGPRRQIVAQSLRIPFSCYIHVINSVIADLKEIECDTSDHDVFCMRSQQQYTVRKTNSLQL